LYRYCVRRAAGSKMNSHGQYSHTTNNRTRQRNTMAEHHFPMDNDASAVASSSSPYQATCYPPFNPSQPLMYVPMTIEGGMLRPITGDVGGLQIPFHNGIPIVWGFRYNNNSNEVDTINSNDRSNQPVSLESSMPSTTDTITTAAYHRQLALTGQQPLGWLPQHVSGSNYTQAVPYGRPVGRRMKPRSRSQGTSSGSKDWEVCFEQMDSCGAVVKGLRRALSSQGQSSLCFVGIEIEKRRMHRLLVEEHILRNVLVQHLRQCQGSKHFCNEIFRAVFSLFLSTADAESLVEKCMLCLNKTCSYEASRSLIPSLFVEKLDIYVICLYDHVERVRRILSDQFVERKESSFVDKGTWERYLSNLQYYQGKAASFLYCRQQLHYLQKQLTELGQSLCHFENDAISRSGKERLLETRSFKAFLESFHSKLEQQVSVDWMAECESKLLVHIMKLFSSSHNIFRYLEASVVSDLEYLRDSKDNVQRQSLKLESFSKLHKRYAAAKEVAKEVNRLMEMKQQRCETMLQERKRLQELNVSLAKILKNYGREHLSRELRREINSLLKVQRNIDAGMEQLFSISFQEVLELIRTSLVESGKKPTRKTARFSLNIPASVVIMESTSTPKSAVSVDIVSPRQRHHRMKSNPDALLHVDRLSPSGLSQMENDDASPDVESISFSQVSSSSVGSCIGEDSVQMVRNHVTSCEKQQVERGNNSRFSTPQKEVSRGLEYAIRTLNLRRLDETTNASCYFDGTVRKCHSTASTPRREDVKDLSCLKKTKTTTVASPKAFVQPITTTTNNTFPLHHRSQRSQSFDDIIVL
jgi:hypothetical protein